MRVSWPRLKPQVLPDREQGLHSLHSPTSQCSDRGKRRNGSEGEKFEATLFSSNIFATCSNFTSRVEKHGKGPY